MTYTTKIEKQTQVLFFIALSFSILGLLYSNSTWPAHDIIGKCISLLGLFLVFFRFLTVLYSMPIRYIIIVLLITPIILHISSKVDEHAYLLFPFFFCISAWNIEFRTIVKFCFWINFCFLIITVSASFWGLIQNKVWTREEYDLVEAVSTQEVRIRNSFGYSYPTNFAVHFTYLNLMWMYLRGGIFKWIDYMALFLSIWFVDYYCNARTEVLMMLLIVISSFYYRLRVRRKANLSWLENKFFICSIPLMAMLILFLEYQYMYSTNEIYQFLDIAISGRLYLAANAINTKGITWFGQFYVQHGAGSIVEYNYIDCQYMVWVIIYGIFTFVFALFLFYLICKKSVQSKEYLIALLLSILAIQNLIFPSLVLLKYNPFFMALFANIHSRSDIKMKAKLVYGQIN